MFTLVGQIYFVLTGDRGHLSPAPDVGADPEMAQKRS